MLGYWGGLRWFGGLSSGLGFVCCVLLQEESLRG